MPDMIDDEIDDVALEALATAYATPPPPALRRRLLAAARGDRTAHAAERAATRWRVVGTIAAGVALALGGLLARSTRLADQRSAQLEALARANAELTRASTPRSGRSSACASRSPRRARCCASSADRAR